MFGKRRRINDLLAGYDGTSPERVRAAIRRLADGDEAEVRVLLDAARTDYRDVLFWDERQRTGRPEAALSEERIAELVEAFGRPTAPSADGAGPPTDVVLLDPGPRSPALMKAVRAATGLGLADVAALLDQPPARVVAGLPSEAAARLQAELEAAGATVELR